MESKRKEGKKKKEGRKKAKEEGNTLQDKLLKSILFLLLYHLSIWLSPLISGFPLSVCPGFCASSSEKEHGKNNTFCNIVLFIGYREGYFTF